MTAVAQVFNSRPVGTMPDAEAVFETSPARRGVTTIWIVTLARAARAPIGQPTTPST